MFEAIPQELKDVVVEAGYKAFTAVQEVLEEILQVLDRVEVELAEWAEDNAAGGVDEESPTNDKYQYLLDNSSGDEQDRWILLEDYLLHSMNAEILDALYESKKREATGPVENQHYDFWSVLKDGFK